jgi:hypothetical protein
MIILKYYLKKHWFLSIFLFTFFSRLIFAQSGNIHYVTINTEYDVANSIDSGSRYLAGWGELTPIISNRKQTFAFTNGFVSLRRPSLGEVH